MSNGCLSFLPGSHRWSKQSNMPSSQEYCRPQHDAKDVVDKYGQLRGVNKRFVRSKPGQANSGTTFEAMGNAEEEPWDDSRAVIEECKAGERPSACPFVSSTESFSSQEHLSSSTAQSCTRAKEISRKRAGTSTHFTVSKARQSTITRIGCSRLQTCHSADCIALLRCPSNSTSNIVMI
jgi:hypothetical protein